MESNVVTVTVEDLQPPVFTSCPADVSGTIQRNETQIDLILGLPQFVDSTAWKP
ncbi:MAG: hypothetical protein R2751_16150 [Bacteroidales bacterium]